MALTRIDINRHTTLIMNGKQPVRIENDGGGEDPVEDAAQYIGHPLESSDPVKGKGGYGWTYRVWFNEDCECSDCLKLK